jgi:hypothetical protein
MQRTSSSGNRPRHHMRSRRPDRSQRRQRTRTRPHKVHSRRKQRLIHRLSSVNEHRGRRPLTLRGSRHRTRGARRLHSHPWLRHNRRLQPRCGHRNPRRPHMQNLRMQQRTDNQRRSNRRLQRKRNHRGPTTTAAQKGSGFNKGFLEHNGTSTASIGRIQRWSAYVPLDTAHLHTVPSTGTKSLNVR